jgi:hypothetical protein
MSKLINKFFEDDERARTIIAAIGLGGGLIVAALFTLNNWLYL